jgi:hypothetical protein
VSFSITEYEIWPRVSVAIQIERARRMGDLLHVTSMEAMRQEQGFIAALDWVLAEAQPKPKQRDEDDE